MRVTFTGTQQGMTRAQRIAVRQVFNRLNYQSQEIVFIHGDCIGADAEAHNIVISVFGWYVEIHPCTIESKRAHCGWNESAVRFGEVHEPRPPLPRNTTMVKRGDLLVATPKEHSEVARSGTWATVRRARKAGKRVIIVWPDGRVEDESKCQR